MYIKITSNFIETANEFIRCIRLFGGEFNEWYVGLTRDSKHSFLEIHQVDLLEKHWILSNESSDAMILYARKFLVELGCQNKRSLDMDNSNRIYLYQISENTRED
ncbi:MAG: hypothetical protein GY714_09005 [Desulfobacterales bacterium]|nr:hypothetical protein [Desulfobacterales bacterium]MCP4159504.1 hypothetical protein [Deltaproteobacteria bacterium]